MDRTGKCTGRRGWLAATAAATVVPVALGAAAVAGPGASALAAAGRHATSSSWASSAWMGGADASPATTLASVRTIIGADSGAAAGLTGQGVGVALIDTGVAPVAGLPAAQVVNGPDLSFESQSSYLRYLDTYGHGTHMAGIIVGNDTATGMKGLAPKAKLTSIKIGTQNGAADVSQMIAALDWVVQHKNDDPANPIRVINLSYGSGGNPPTYNDPLQFAAEKAWQAGIVVVAAVGNAGNSAGKIANPSTDEWIIGVGATTTKGTLTTSDDEMTTFTNLASKGKQVNILAPGTSILSLRDTGSNIDNLYPAARVGSTLFRGSGTSQATAVTSAAVALLLQAKPTATPDQIKSWLLDGATYFPNGIAAGMGLKELNVNGALAMSASYKAQHWNLSTGLGTLEAARGTSHVVWDQTQLTGEKTVWGPLASATWAPRSAAKTAWSGGLWMGYRLAGDGWTGTSWASKTWAPATWTSSPWGASSTGWTDPAWSGRTWAGAKWSAGTWTGRTWASDDWSSAYWG